MKKLLNLVFSFFYIFAKSEVSTASFFLIHEPRIPKSLKELKKKYNN